MRIAQHDAKRVGVPGLPAHHGLRNDGIGYVDGNRTERDVPAIRCWNEMNLFARDMAYYSDDGIGSVNVAGPTIDRQSNEGSAGRLPWLDRQTRCRRRVPHLRTGPARNYHEDEGAQAHELVQNHRTKIQPLFQSSATHNARTGTNTRCM
jgi:hypothetical protein